MTNVVSAVIGVMSINNPLFFYVFIVFIIAGVGLTYLYRLEVGLGLTAVLSAIFYYADVFIPWIYITLVLSIVLLALSLIGLDIIIRWVRNISNWFYLKRFARNAPLKKKEQ